MRWKQHEQFVLTLGTAHRYAIGSRSTDGGAAVPFDRDARRRRNRAARKSRQRNRRS